MRDPLAGAVPAVAIVLTLEDPEPKLLFRAGSQDDRDRLEHWISQHHDWVRGVAAILAPDLAPEGVSR